MGGKTGYRECLMIETPEQSDRARPDRPWFSIDASGSGPDPRLFDRSTTIGARTVVRAARAGVPSARAESSSSSSDRATRKVVLAGLAGEMPRVHPSSGLTGQENWHPIES